MPTSTAPTATARARRRRQGDRLTAADVAADRALAAESSRPLPPCATDAPPGSEAKVRVMVARYAAGVQVHHPGDARVARAGLTRIEGDGRDRRRRPRELHVYRVVGGSGSEAG